MPRRYFWNKKRAIVPVAKQQCCVVCYTEFYPYPTTPSKWETSITRLFYTALDIPPLPSGDDDEDEIMSLPYCPQCHTKISIMFNLHCQLESIQHQYDCVRNEIAFLVVESIDRNCRNGPMDFIRQQIFEKWREYHAEETSREDYQNKVGLDAMFFGSAVESQNLSIVADSVDQNDYTSSTKKTDQNSGNVNDKENNEEGDKSNMDSEDGATKQLDHSADDYHNLARFIKVEMKDEAEIQNHEEIISNEDNDSDSLAPNSVYMSVTKVGTTNSQSFQSQVQSKDPSDRVNSVQLINYRGRGRRGRRLATNSMPRLTPVEMGQVNGSRHVGRGRGRGRGRAGRKHQSLAPHETAGQAQVTLTTRARTRKDLSPLPSGSDDMMVIKEEISTNHLESAAVSLFKQKSQLAGEGRRGVGRPKKRVNCDSATNESSNSSSIQSPISPVKKVKHQSIDEYAGLFPCVLCSKKFENASQLLRHESNYHPNSKAIHCDACGKGFSSRLTLRRHKVNIHKVLGDKAKKCPTCGKTFIKQHTYDYHIQTHKSKVTTASTTSLKKNITKPSGELSPLSSSLKATMTNGQSDTAVFSGSPMIPKSRKTSDIHLMKSGKFPRIQKGREPTKFCGKNDLICNVCKRRFPYPALLKLHSLTHTTKPCNSNVEVNHPKANLSCPVCEKCFSKVEILNKHIKTHSMSTESPSVDIRGKTATHLYPVEVPCSSPTLDGNKSSNLTD